MTMSISITNKWRVDARHEIVIPMKATAVWGQMRDLRRFITRDPLHRYVHVLPSDSQTFDDKKTLYPIGTKLLIEHRLFGIGPNRNSRILRWQEGSGYAFSDLSMRNSQRSFPHICAYEVRPRNIHESILSIQARGRWTAHLMPKWVVRYWLHWVLRTTGWMIQLELLAVRKAQAKVVKRHPTIIRPPSFLLLLGTLLALSLGACEKSPSSAKPPLTTTRAAGENAALWYWRAIAFQYRWEDFDNDKLDELLGKPVGVIQEEAAVFRLSEVEILGSLQKALECDFCTFAINRDAGPGMMLPHGHGMQSLIKRLCLDARLCIAEEDMAAGIERLTIAVRMCRDFSSDRNYISSKLAADLFALVCDEIQHAREMPDDSSVDWEVLRIELAQIDSSNPFRLRDVPAFERELNSQWFLRECDQGDCEELIVSSLGKLPTLREPPYRKLTGDEIRDHLIMFDEYLVEVAEQFETKSGKALRKVIARHSTERQNQDFGALAPLLALPFDRLVEQLIDTQNRLAEMARILKPTSSVSPK